MDLFHRFGEELPNYLERRIVSMDINFTLSQWFDFTNHDGQLQINSTISSIEIPEQVGEKPIVAKITTKMVATNRNNALLVPCATSGSVEIPATLETSLSIHPKHTYRGIGLHFTVTFSFTIPPVVTEHFAIPPISAEENAEQERVALNLGEALNYTSHAVRDSLENFLRKRPHFHLLAFLTGGNTETLTAIQRTRETIAEVIQQATADVKKWLGAFATNTYVEITPSLTPHNSDLAIRLRFSRQRGQIVWVEDDDATFWFAIRLTRAQVSAKGEPTQLLTLFLFLTIPLIYYKDKQGEIQELVLDPAPSGSVRIEIDLEKSLGEWRKEAAIAIQKALIPLMLGVVAQRRNDLLPILQTHLWWSEAKF